MLQNLITLIIRVLVCVSLFIAYRKNKQKAMRQLDGIMALEPYAMLREVSGMPIAQAEHTIIIKDKPKVTTMGGD